jgi:hypothetical protein
LQRYRYATSQVNVESSTLNTAFQTMAKGIGSGSLFTSLEKVDAGLVAQVKKAKSVDEAFKMITGAAGKYSDTSQRTAVLMAAFGKAGNQLVPMLGNLSEQLDAAGKFGNIISPNSIVMATKFNSAMTDVKYMVQSFGDIIRGAIVQYAVPLIEKFREWAAANREMIATKINAFIAGFANTVKTVLPYAIRLVSTVIKFAPAILIAVAAIKAFSVAKAVYQGVTIAVQAYNAMLAAQKTATTATTVAQTGLNAAMKANIIGLIVSAVVILIGLFVQLAQKVGGVKNAFIVVGQTLMKWVLTPFNVLLDAIQFILPMGARIGVIIAESFKAAGQTILKYMLTPINLVISGVAGLLGLIGKIPGADWAKNAADGIKGFQDKMNTALTGSESTLLSDGPTALLDPARAASAGMSDKIAAADTWAMSGVSGLQGFQDKMNTLLTGSTSTLTNSGPGFLADPYRNAREAELTRQKDEDEMKETNDLLSQMLGKMDDQIDATNNLADHGSATSPAKLRWGAMEQEDFFEIQRLGI